MYFNMQKISKHHLPGSPASEARSRKTILAFTFFFALAVSGIALGQSVYDTQTATRAAASPAISHHAYSLAQHSRLATKEKHGNPQKQNIHDQTGVKHNQSVSVGDTYACIIRQDQSIACWQYNQTEQIKTPPGRYIAVSVGQRYTCAIRQDQSMVCWKYNDDEVNILSAGHDDYYDSLVYDAHKKYGDDEANIPGIPQERFIALSSRGGYVCAVRPEWSIKCWHQNIFTSAIMIGDIDNRTNAPQGRFTTVSAGRTYACGIRDDQSIACWGDNRMGQINAPSGQFTSLSAGDYHSCAIRQDHSVACWGYGDDSVLSAPQGQFIAISTGYDHACGIRDDQSIACWGDNQLGQLNAPPGPFVAISSREFHSCAIRANDTHACWGWNSNKQASDTPVGDASVYKVASLDLENRHEKDVKRFTKIALGSDIVLLNLVSRGESPCLEDYDEHATPADCDWRVSMITCDWLDLSRNNTMARSHECRPRVQIKTPPGDAFNRVIKCKNGGYQLTGFYSIQYATMHFGQSFYNAIPATVNQHRALETFKHFFKNNKPSC